MLGVCDVCVRATHQKKPKIANCLKIPEKGPSKLSKKWLKSARILPQKGTTGDTEKAGCLHTCLNNGEGEGPGAKKTPTQFRNPTRISLFWPLGPPSLVCLSSDTPQKKKTQRKVAGPFAITLQQFPITPQQFPITPQQFPITPQQFPITPRLHLHF